MHHHLEVILPPPEDIEAAIETILKPYCEHNEGEERSRHAFWDWYVLGGRFAGSKVVDGLDKAKLDEFNTWCYENVTVSNFQSGKQEISPASQIPVVDAKWNELFPRPDGKQVPCPLFKHSNDQYGQAGPKMIEGDICRLDESLHVKCAHVIFAGPSYDHKKEEYVGPMEVTFRLQDTAWNGVNHMPVAWDETIGDALRQVREKWEDYADAYKATHLPQDDWLVVTVDYHT